MQPLVTVIIPTFNSEDFINETIISVLNQDYPLVELIIVDDGSSDKTCEIVESYNNKIKLIKQNNSGVCSARNRGIEEANGDYLCFMDHDDFWFPSKISLQIETFESYPDIGVVYSNFSLWNPYKDAVYPRPTDIGGDQTLTTVDPEFSGWIYHLLLIDCWILTSTAMINIDVLTKCGNFDECLPYSEDWDLWFRISEHYQFVKLSRITTLYRQHLEQGNRKTRKQDYRSMLLLKYRKKNGLSSQDGRRIKYWQFQSKLAEYRAEFGLHHLYHDHNLKIALKSLLCAWISYPVKIKYLAYLFAALIGWKPKW